MTERLKVVALISGGKDSCYNMVQCVSEGHRIVALANLHPKEKDELDSYMFQTVGHHLIEMYAQAMGLPLYRRVLEGGSLSQGADYTETENDEVEDLFQLLKEVKEKEDINAVSVGAILSDYQRVRVEHVCSRLGLTPLSYLWRRNQTELLQEMVSAGVDSILIKVAALGLTPHKHLGKSLAQIYPYMLTMKEKFGLNVCGEGGEYETFTLDCPLFTKRIVIDKQELIMHSDDPISPVGYLNLLEAHLEEKDIDVSEIIKHLKIQRSSDLLTEYFPDGSPDDATCFPIPTVEAPISSPPLSNLLAKYIEIRHHSSGYFWVTGVMAIENEKKSMQELTAQAMDVLKSRLQDKGFSLNDLVINHLYVRDMAEFHLINQIYKKYFSINPPSRVCVEVGLPSNVALRMDAVGFKQPPKTVGDEFPIERRTMHVQGLSHWAPANIGPYSQAVRIGESFYVAGQIPMVPANLNLIPGQRAQCRLTLRHVLRIFYAMAPSLKLHHILLGICYVTHPDTISIAKKEYESALKESLPEESEELSELRISPLTAYVVVPKLPKAALVEWQVYASLCPEVMAGRIDFLQGSLQARLDYRYVPAPVGLLSFIITIDQIGVPKPINRALCGEAVRAAHQALQNTHVQLTSGFDQTPEFKDTLRSIRIFYSLGGGGTSEDDLLEDYKAISTSLPLPVLVPVVSMFPCSRVMTWCS